VSNEGTSSSPFRGLHWALAILCANPPLVSAQAEPVALRFSAPQLNCTRFTETAESDIRTETGGRVMKQTSGRIGTWQFRAQAAVDGVLVEGWLDSLSLWRKSPETTLRPDTDGLLGGRYRGLLGGSGTYVSRARPFVPEEVAEVTAMGGALDDFFPPLPQRPLRPTQAWTNSAGISIRRLADSGMSGVPLYRFELEIRRAGPAAPIAGDTAKLRVRQVSREQGTFVWHPAAGLIRRERRIVVETQVPAGRTIRQPVRSRLEQHITVLRDLSVSPPRDDRCQLDLPFHR
jgi:hypothetical protein